MTGRIKSLSKINASGFIKADSGLNVHFDSSAILAPGAAGVAAGQLVTFDLEESKWPTAINVRIATEFQPAHSTQEGAPGTYLQYVGFSQTGTIRTYRFKRISCGEQTREFIVNADMGLFAKHHVAIQEGPALSLRLLTIGRDSSVPASWPPSQSLSELDMLAHLAKKQTATGPMRNRKPKLDS